MANATFRADARAALIETEAKIAALEAEIEAEAPKVNRDWDFGGRLRHRQQQSALQRLHVQRDMWEKFARGDA